MNDKNIEFEMIKKRNLSLLLLALVAAITGFIDALSNHNGLTISILRLVMPLIAIATIYYWIVCDAKLLNYRLPRYIKCIIILFGIIGVPIYFWQTRNFKKFCFNLGGLWIFIYYIIVYYIFKVITVSGLSSLDYY